MTKTSQGGFCFLEANYIHYRIEFLNEKGREQLMKAHKDFTPKNQKDYG